MTRILLIVVDGAMTLGARSGADEPCRLGEERVFVTKRPGLSPGGQCFVDRALLEVHPAREPKPFGIRPRCKNALQNVPGFVGPPRL
jgi:hypothetical protein